jgi:hypothetical protein
MVEFNWAVVEVEHTLQSLDRDLTLVGVERSGMTQLIDRGEVVVELELASAWRR